MRKRIMAFHDVLLFAIICSPMIFIAVILLFMLVTKGTSERIYENLYLVLIFAITFMVPIGGTIMLRYLLLIIILLIFIILLLQKVGKMLQTTLILDGIKMW